MVQLDDTYLRQIGYAHTHIIISFCVHNTVELYAHTSDLYYTQTHIYIYITIYYISKGMCV